MGNVTRAAVAAATGLLLSLAGWSIAEACGGFFRARTVDPEQLPSLSREKVLLIHDAASGTEHFIREVAFTRAREPFGFVVPTPSRPSVAAVEHTPFSALRDSFPFEPPSKGGAGFGRGGGAPRSAGVEVLEITKVGSFTAFVLAATDANALSKWLADNELVSSAQADAWLAHYVELGFYYVAMRYDPPAEDAEISDAVVAETMRISFATPLPYYPYLEPDPQPTAPSASGPRLMELWVVGSVPVVPVARVEREGVSRWVRPLKHGERYLDAREDLQDALEPELEQLLPSGSLVLQTFQDQKILRAGFDDILFASEVPQTWTPAQRDALAPLLPILDPGLGPTPMPTEAP